MWACLRSGDGVHCPLYDGCSYRRSGGWCIEEKLDYIESLRARAERGDAPVLSADTASLGFSPQCKIVNFLEQLAYSLLKKGDISCVPVPMSLAALAVEPDSLEVRFVPLKSVYGGVWESEGGWIVQLNSRAVSDRRRFTLFHEVFHILAHVGIGPEYHKPTWGGARFYEWMADHFAVCVSVPIYLLEREWSKCQDIVKMARHFDVPFMVMVSVLKRAKLID